MTDWWSGREEYEAPDLDTIDCPVCGQIVWMLGYDEDRDKAIAEHRCPRW